MEILGAFGLFWRSYPKKVLVVHGYGKNRDGSLGLNELVCKKAAELWKTGEYKYLLLPAGVNEDTGDGLRILSEDHMAYLSQRFLFDQWDKWIEWGTVRGLLGGAKPIASDTMTECVVAYRMLDHLYDDLDMEDFFEIHAVGVFPHSLKIWRCWNLFLQKGIAQLFPRYGVEVRFGAVHHIAPWLDSRSETVRQLLMNVISTVVGVFDPLGKRWPATTIKKRRRDLYTPAHLRDRVIF